MTKRIQKVFLTVAALGALAVGASAIASAQTPATTPPPVKQSATPTTQSGAQDTPDAAASGTAGTKEAPGTEAPDATDTPDATGSAGATDPAGANDTPDANEAPGAESATNSDGPGGHADEPGNPTADHQATGQE
jgi:hypothetical protein